MEGSPVWKRPSEVMKIHRRRKSLSQKKVTQEQKADFIYKSPSKAVKRRNPFTASENTSNKRHQRNEDVEQSQNSCALFSMLDSTEVRSDKILGRGTTSVSGDLPQLNDCKMPEAVEKSTTVSSPGTNQQSDVLNKDPETQASPHLPVDWCLKTKSRLVSSRPLIWCTQLKSAEEARGVTKFLRDQTSQVDGEADEKEEFQKSLMYWVHPNLPWVRLFPRIIDDSRSGKGLSFLLQDDIQTSLQAAWEESFTSAFHQFRARLCPYFYLCTHQFTVLFCENGLSQSDIVAMVNPTTRGFRELLQNEGISFTLPVGEKQQSPVGGKSTGTLPREKPRTTPQCDDSGEAPPPYQHPGNEEEEGDEMFETDEGASGWLESIGLDKKEFPTLDPRKVKLQREGFRVIDHRPESLVYVEGSDVQALFNFLLNCRTCTATSGTQAGVPPTILAPNGFKGATLKCNKVKHTVVKQPDKDGAITHAHIVEVTGPILPHHTQSLITLYHKTQHEDFGVVFNNHDTTAAFNILGRLQTENNHTHLNSVTEDTQEGGTSDRIEQSVRTKLFRHKPISDRICAIKEIVCTPEGFTWKS